MTPEQIDRVFGRGRLKMVTGDHVEVFREAVAAGERRCYTKRFLNTPDGDFGQWTEREWRILARLIGHGVTCVPDVVQFDRGRLDGVQLVQTFDAGVTVDQWATLLPVSRDGRVYRHIFEDCAHWWALAHHCLRALHAIHPLELVHLDIKGDNVCIPYSPASFDADAADLRLRPVFDELALIDFAFALISRASLTTPLPIGWQKEYDYQSPRLLAALEAGRNGDLRETRELDWRCDLYSLAAMLKRYLPDANCMLHPAVAAGWSAERYDAAKALILRIRGCHDSELPSQRPHAALLDVTGARLADDELQRSLECGWTLAREVVALPATASPLTPVTRVAPSIRVARSGRPTAVTIVGHAGAMPIRAAHVTPVSPSRVAPPPSVRVGRQALLGASIALAAVATGLAYIGNLGSPIGDASQPLLERVRVAAMRAVDAASQIAHRDEGTQRASTMPDARNTVADAKDTAIDPTGAAAGANRRGSVPGPDAKGAAVDSKATAVDANDGSPAASPADSPREADPGASSVASAAPADRASDAISAPSSAFALRRSRSADLPSAENAAARRAAAAQPAPAEAPAAPLVAQRNSPSTPANAATRRSAAPAPPSQANAPPRSAKTSRATTAVASAETRVDKVPSAPPAHRVYAPWASLEPPVWALSNYKGKGPGLPPGALAAERSTKVATPSEGSRVEVTPLAAAASRGDTVVTTPSTAPPAATIALADAQRASAATATATPAAAAARDTGRAASDAVSLPLSRGSKTAAPIEERGIPLAPSAQVASAAVEPRASTIPIDQPAPEYFAVQGRRLLQNDVPRVAARAEPQVARILWMASSAYYQTQERAVADATRSSLTTDDSIFLARATIPGEARRLNDEARTAWGVRRNLAEAFDLQVRAFGADPRDPEVSGNLALLYLKRNPPQPEMARQVALVALAARDPQFHSARMEDWFTFAIASALSRREADATNALFVTLALTGDVDRRCVAALSALATYGERLRRPVEAMFMRLQAQGRAFDAPACAWPPSAQALSRLP